MARHTGKAITGSGSLPGSRHTSVAQGRKGAGGAKSPRSSHSTKATGASRPPAQLSRGGGTTAASGSLVGKARQSYLKRNNTGRPSSR